MRTILRINFIFLVAFFIVFLGKAQLFYNNGGTIEVTNNAILYVGGDLTNLDNGGNDGIVRTAGSIYITGDLDNQSGAEFITNQGGGIDTVLFVGSATQNITGIMDATASNTNSFYNLWLDNSSVLDISAATGLQVSVMNTLTFSGGKGIITTGAKDIYTVNSAVGSIVGHDASGWVNGNLRREVITGAANNYDFPVGTTVGSLGYQLATLQLQAGFTNTTDFRGNFVQYPGAPTFSQAECGVYYTCSYPNHGKWAIDESDGTTFGGSYNIVVTPSNLGATSGCGVTTRTILKKDGGPWLLQGTACTNGLYRNALTGFSEFAIAITDEPLDVEGLLLTATPLNNSIQLDWTTEQETNNHGFELERSTDDLSYEYITWLDGVGNSNKQQNYAFIDNNVTKNTVYYYRLKQFDFDGSMAYSNTVEAIITANLQLQITGLYPNPNSNGNLTVEITSPDKNDLNISFFNAIGQEVLYKSYNLSAGNHKLKIPVNALAAGMYEVIFKTNNQQIVKKLVIK